MKNQRTIQTILSLKTGKQIDVDSLFENPSEKEAEIFQLRAKIEEQIQTEQKDYVCLFCKQPVAIRGRKNLHSNSTHFYFTHPYKSRDCIIKTDNNLTEEEIRCIKYNGVKESYLHESMKKEIAYYLSLEKKASIIIDEIYKDNAISKKWRKPDILAVFSDKKIAFELQLSTTFLSVIIGRTIFYKKNGIFLIWIFPEFSLEDDMQKFTQKDVYYNNNFNVYVFDKSARDQSKIEKELVLKCYYKEWIDLVDRVEDEWVLKYIKLSDLTFDFNNKELYFYDSQAEKQKVLDVIEERKKRREEIKKTERTKEKVQKAVRILRDFYKNDHLPDFQKCFLDIIETTDEIEELNKELKFSTERTHFISELFFKRTKFHFLSFIFEENKIKLDTSKLYYDGITILEHLLSLQLDNFKEYTSLLFYQGYILTKSDKKLLKDLVSDNYSIDSISKWSFIYYLSQITRKEYIKEITNIDRKILNALFSLKKGFVIGSELANLKQVSNNIFEYHKSFGDIYIAAMKIYNQYEKLLEEDKKGKLKSKIEKYYIESPQQEYQYDAIIYEIFPELKIGD